MASTLRYDSCSVVGIKTLGSGAIRVDGNIARTGVLEYSTPGGVRREYRPPEEVFSPESMALFADLPVTVMHPASGEVTPENAKTLSVGHISADVRKDGEFLLGSVVVQDAVTIAAVNRGELRELSAGYKVDVDMTPGVTPSGERYDAVQRNIRANHVALLPRGAGRSGPEVALRLDSKGDQIAPVNSSAMSTEIDATKATIRIDGAEEIRRLDAKVESLTKELDAAKGANAALSQRVAELTDPKRLDSLVTERVSLIDSAKKVLGDERLDGLAPADIRRKVVAKSFPSLNLDGKSAEYISGQFDVAVSGDFTHPKLTEASKIASQAATDGARTDGKGAVTTLDDARRNDPNRNRYQAAKGVLGVIRGNK